MLQPDLTSFAAGSQTVKRLKDLQFRIKLLKIVKFRNKHFIQYTSVIIKLFFSFQEKSYF